MMTPFHNKMQDGSACNQSNSHYKWAAAQLFSGRASLATTTSSGPRRLLLDVISLDRRRNNIYEFKSIEIDLQTNLQRKASY